MTFYKKHKFKNKKQFKYIVKLYYTQLIRYFLDKK